jgi:hypothetical protein
MEKKWLEISVSTGLVLLMIALMLVVEVVAPAGMKSTGFVLATLVFIVLMGFSGLKLIEMQ